MTDSMAWQDAVSYVGQTPLGNAMNGGDTSYTRSPLGSQVMQLTNICWHLIAPTSTADFLSKVF